MLNKEEIEKAKERLQKRCDKAEDYTIDQVFLTDDIHAIEVILQCIDQLETREQKLIDKVEERISDVEKCYNDLIEPYYDKTINMINTSFMTKKEKEEFINKRNCLLVQKQCYEEILSIVKGEKIIEDKRN